MRRILLYTATGVENLGDECILLAEYRYLRTRYPDAQIRIATYNPLSHLLPEDSRISFFSYFPNKFRVRPLSNIAYFFRNCYELFRADLVIIGGGGLFYDNEAGQSFQKQLFEWHLRVWVGRLFRKSILFWAIGIDVQEKNIWKLVQLFKGSRTTVSVRDSQSQQLLSDIGISSMLVRDAVLTLPNFRLHKASSPPRVGLALRAGYMPNERENVRSMITLLRNAGFEPVFLVHSFHPSGDMTNDAASFWSIAKELSVPMTASIQETYETYQSLQLVVSMRLHASILAFSMSIPFIPISYATKTDEALRVMGITEYQHAAWFDIDLFAWAVRAFVAQGKLQQFALASKYDTIRITTLESYNRLFDGL